MFQILVWAAALNKMVLGRTFGILRATSLILYYLARLFIRGSSTSVRVDQFLELSLYELEEERKKYERLSLRFKKPIAANQLFEAVKASFGSWIQTVASEEIFFKKM